MKQGVWRMADLLAIMLVLLLFAVLPLFFALWLPRMIENCYKKYRIRFLDWRVRRNYAVLEGDHVDAHLPLEVARGTVFSVLLDLGCRFVESDDGVDEFARGDFRIKQLPTSHPVKLRDVPMHVVVAYGCYGGRTFLVISYTSGLRVRFSPAAAETFRCHAKRELEILLGTLRQTARAQGSEGSARAQEPRAAEDASTARVEGDLALLGLGRFSSWDSVKNAYRECCMKYHPDRLAGQNVAPHLVELAVTRFKEISAAYHRLKERMAPDHGRGSAWTSASPCGASKV